MIDRRGFLRAIVGGFAVLVGAPGSVKQALAAFIPTRRYRFFTNEEGDVILEMVSLIAPHKGLEEVHRETAAQIDDLVGKSPNLQRLYIDGIKELDETAKKISGGRGFGELSDRWKVEALKAIEAKPFFQNVYSNTIAFFYGNPKVWKAVGYPGPSHRELGGYIARGFDRLEW